MENLWYAKCLYIGIVYRPPCSTLEKNLEELTNSIDCMISGNINDNVIFRRSKYSEPTQKKWRSNHQVNRVVNHEVKRGVSRKIAANCGKFHSEKDGDHFFYKL